MSKRKTSTLHKVARGLPILLIALSISVLALGTAESGISTGIAAPADASGPEGSSQNFAFPPVPPRLSVPTALLAPAISATKTDTLLVDNDSDSAADPGDTLRYTTFITQSGTTDATGANFSDTIDANTTLVAGSLRTTPIARHDGPYASLGNVGITVTAGSGVLANDNDPDGTTPTLTIASFDASSSNGGVVTVNADGGFRYNPPPGFEGVDSFTYTAQDSDGNSDSAAVFITVSDVIWFIDNTATGGGDGRLNSPFNSISAYNNGAADDPGDIIFLHSGSGNYTSGISLLNDQYLIGQGATASIATIAGITVPSHSNALPAPSGSRPEITTTTGDGVLLGQNNTLRGFNVGNTAGVGISDSGGTVGTLNVSEVAISGTGGGIEVDNGGTLAVTLDSLSSSGSTDEGIHLANISGSFAVSSGSISTTGMSGVIIDGNPSVGGSVTLTSVSASSATNGISIRDTTGSFTVTGTGSANSGGTLSNHSAEGVLLNNVSNISLTDMVINQSATNSTQGIDATSVTGLTLVRTTITAGSNSSYALLGSSITNMTATSTIFDGGGGNVPNIDGVRITNLLGNSTLTDSTFRNGKDINLLIENSTTSGNPDTITIAGTSFSNSAGGDHLQVDANSTANLRLFVNASAGGNTAFSGTGQDGIQLEAQGSATFQSVVTQATFNNTLGSTVNMSATGNGHLIARVHDLTGLTSSGTNVINMINFDTSTIEATIENNTITSGTAGNGIRVIQEGNGTITVNLVGNVISGITQGNGILVQGRAGTGGNGEINATINNNNVTTTGVLSLDGIEVTSGSSAGGDTNTICLNMLNNTSSSGAFDGYFLRHRTGSTFRLQDFAGPATSAGITNWVNTTKSNTGSVFVSDAAGFTAAPANCTTPTLPSTSTLLSPQTDLGNQALNTTSSNIIGAFEGNQTLTQPQYLPIQNDHPFAPNDQQRSAAGRRGLARPVQPTQIHVHQPAAALFSGETINLTAGTLNPGQVVRITFDVTVDNPLPAGTSQVCNQGLFSGDNFANVFTDDPDVGGITDPTCTPVEATPDLVIDKDDGGISVAPGDTITYTLNFTNSGDQGATGVIINEIIPADTTFNPGASTAGWVCVPDNNPGSTCTQTIGALGGGGSSGSVVFAVTVVNPIPAGVTQIDNTASIADDNANGPDPNPGDNTANDTTPADAAPDLGINKQDGDVSFNPGDTIAYTLVYTNAGDQDATSVVITDTVPGNTTFNAGASTAGWSCSPDNSAGNTCTLAIGSLSGGGGGGSITFAVDVDDPAPGVNGIDNTACIHDDGSNGSDPDPVDNCNTENTPALNNPPVLSNATITSPVAENEPANLTGNISDLDSTDTFTLTVDWGDGTPAETFTYPSGTTSFDETHVYLDDNPTGTPTDSYALNLSISDSKGGSDSAATFITVNNLIPIVNAGPDQTASRLNPMVSFSGAFIDTGSLDTHSIQWDFGDGNTSTGTLTPSHTFPTTEATYTVTLTVIDDDTGVGTDTLLVTVSNASPVASSDTEATDEDTPLNIAAPGLLSNDSDPENDPLVVIDFAATSANGANISVDTNGAYTYDPTAALALQALNPGETLTDTFSYTISDGVLTDTASVQVAVSGVNDLPSLSVQSIDSPINENETATLVGSIFDIDTTDSMDIDWGDGTVESTPNPASTTFTKTHSYLDDDPSATSSDDYTVTITLTDEGSSVVSFETVTVINLPPTVDAGSDKAVIDGEIVQLSGVYTDPGTLDTHTILWDFGDGDTITDTLSPTHTYPAPGVYTATLTVTDDDTGSDSDSLSISVSPLADLALSKTVSDDPALSGATLIYTLTATNLGPSDATGVEIADTLPPEVSFLSASPGCAESNGTVTCALDDLAESAAQSVQISATLTITLTSTITNSASLTADQPDPVLENNTTSVTTIVQPTETPIDDDFEDGVGPGWCVGQLNVSPSGEGFLGQFGNETVCLVLDDLPYHTKVSLSFDLYIIRSWDGNAVEPPERFIPYQTLTPNETIGPDRWFVTADGALLLDTTFSNWESFLQSYPLNYPEGNFPARSGAAQVNSLGYDFFDSEQDSVYKLSFAFPHSGNTLLVDFGAFGLQDITDESWGLDNVRVTLDAGGGFPNKIYMPVIFR